MMPDCYDAAPAFFACLRRHAARYSTLMMPDA